VTEGSVEEKIVERAARKLKVDHLIMQRGKFNHDDNKKVNSDEMVNMIQHGA
jgi:SWI/SNF-related matrix-associated actin-dependent regulator of chromatin subfamily A member 5